MMQQLLVNIRRLLLVAALASSVAAGCARDWNPANAEAQPEDAGVDPSDAESDAATECAPFADSRELFVFDSDGPTDLLGDRAAREGTIEFAGKVTQQGLGFPFDAVPSGAQMPERPETFRFLRVQAAEHSWTVALSDVASFGVQDGVDVVLGFRYRSPGFSPTLAALSIHVAGQLAFSYTLGGKVESLAPPSELFIGQGAPVCIQQSECGAWSRYTLRVHDTYAGTTEELSPGEQRTLGDYTVVYGDDSQELSESACFDWFTSRSQLIVYRSKPLTGRR